MKSTNLNYDPSLEKKKTSNNNSIDKTEEKNHNSAEYVILASHLYHFWVGNYTSVVLRTGTIFNKTIIIICFLLS